MSRMGSGNFTNEAGRKAATENLAGKLVAGRRMKGKEWPQKGTKITKTDKNISPRGLRTCRAIAAQSSANGTRWNASLPFGFARWLVLLYKLRVMGNRNS